MNAIRVLLVEDSEDDALLVIRALERNGYKVFHERVDTAESFEAALTSKQWDIVISDYSLPGFDGVTALAIAKRRRFDLPFLIVSGTVGEETAVEAMRAGANDYLIKGNLLRLGPTVERELREAKNRSKLKDQEEQLRQSQKMEAIGRLAGGIAHDFNNVLTVIILHCDSVLNEIPKSSPFFSTIAEIRGAGSRAATLTRQLLAFSRKQALQPKVLNLNKVTENLATMLQRFIGEDIELITKLDPDLRSIRIDPGQIEQVIMNLAVNSRDAMPKGGNLSIETANVEVDSNSDLAGALTPGAYVKFSLTDNGCGMDPETQKRIFEPFFTTKAPDKGTGLGLSTVYGIVAQSHGHITVSSSLGAGTAFDIYFPIVDLPPEPLEKDERRFVHTKAAREQRQSKILLVEDQEDVRTALSQVLQRQGYRVTTPRSPQEAIKHIAEDKEGFELLISDVIMPNTSGPELAREVRKRHPALKVLFISGYTDEELDHEDLSNGKAHFLQKPFAIDEFLAKVRDVLSKPGSW
ncbi:MAG: response regulator [Bdellovibrionota bacterium]